MSRPSSKIPQLDEQSIPTLLEFWQVMLDPAQNRGVRQRDASVRHHDDQISQAQFETRVPAHTQDDDLSVEMASLERIGWCDRHEIPSSSLPTSFPNFAMEPSVPFGRKQAATKISTALVPPVRDNQGLARRSRMFWLCSF